MPFEAKAFMGVVDVQLVLSGEITFGEAEVVNGIEQIGFTNTIAAANANNAFGELKFLMKIILELVQ